MPNIGMRAGTEAARLYEKKRASGRRSQQVTEVKYGSMIRFIIKVIYHALLVMLIPGIYLLWDALNHPDAGSGVIREFFVIYVLILLYFIYFYHKIMYWSVVRTETGIVYSTFLKKREISYDDLIYGARRQPVKQTDNAWVFATSKSDIKIITTDVVDWGFEFCQQLCTDLRISRPAIKNTTRRRYLRGFGGLLFMMPLLFLHLAYWSVNESGTNGFVILACIFGAISLGMILVSYCIDR